MRNKIEGVLTAIVTPFTEEGALHLPGLKRRSSASWRRGTVFSAAGPTVNSLC